MGKHLDFYMKYARTKILPKEGLCGCAIDGLLDKKLLRSFYPTGYNLGILLRRGLSVNWWGYPKPVKIDDAISQKHAKEFTDLRQTIVLFMAAMKNEL